MTEKYTSSWSKKLEHMAEFWWNLSEISLLFPFHFLGMRPSASALSLYSALDLQVWASGSRFTKNRISFCVSQNIYAQHTSFPKWYSQSQLTLFVKICMVTAIYVPSQSYMQLCNMFTYGMDCYCWNCWNDGLTRRCFCAHNELISLHCA